MPSGAVTLGQAAASLSLLAVACNRWERAGRLRTDSLLAEHGPALPMPTLRQIIAADCPRMRAGLIHDPCGVHFPGLAGITGPAR